MEYTREDREKLLASAVSYLIDGQELYEASILLLCELYIEEGQSSYSGNHSLTDVSIELTGNRAIYEIIKNQEHAATKAIHLALEAVLPASYYLESLTSHVVFTNFDSDWRAKLFEIIQGKGALNQCIPIQDKPRYTWEYLYFRSAYEIAIAKTLSEQRLLFLPNCMARFSQEHKNKEADFLVCYDGKWGIIEVDGETYHTNAAKDHERDRLFRSHGISVVEHYTAKRCIDNPKSVVQEFLELLKKNG